jgi:multicomponent K+:H+ antiporter subunit D
LYYAVQSTLTSAGLFLLVGILVNREDVRPAPIEPPETGAEVMLLGGLYFLLAIAMVGMPPLAGFLGKLLILDAARAGGETSLVWPAILITSLLLILGFARAGIQTFWTTPDRLLGDPGRAGFRTLPVAVIAVLIGAMGALSVFAGPAMTDMTATATQLLEPRLYIDAVLKSAPRTAAMVTP